MFRRTILKTTLAVAFAASALLATAASSQDVIKLGSIAPKTGPLAGGAVVTQWPNVELWVEQVNSRGGLNVAGKRLSLIHI